MSSQLTQYVSVFNGNGWLLWCSQMQAYLMAQGQGAFITPGFSEPSVNATQQPLVLMLQLQKSIHSMKLTMSEQRRLLHAMNGAN